VVSITLGRTGLRVAPVAVGLWQAGLKLWGKTSIEELRNTIEEALVNGITLFDTAEIYGWGRSEELLGRILKGRDAAIISKIAGYHTTRHGFHKAAQSISRRLGTIPAILLHHWPPPFHTPLCKVVGWLEELVNKGYTEYIGVSNYPGRLLDKAMQCTKRHEIVVDQVQYSLAYRTPENDVTPVTGKEGVSIMAWSPLAKGALASRVEADNWARRSDPVFREAARDKILQEALEKIAVEEGLTKAQVSLLWLRAKNAIPVVGVRRKNHVDQIVGILDRRLSPQAVEVLDKASERYLYRWGRSYGSLKYMRLIPAPLQWLSLRLLGGV